MDKLHFFSRQSKCNPGITGSFSPISPTEEDQGPINFQDHSLHSPPPFSIRLAMRISRARWFNFLRRVFHYQNGSRSNLGSNPFNSGTWMSMELVSLIVQLFFLTYTLNIAKEEKPFWTMRTWISGYALGCILSLMLLCWRYQLFFLDQADGVSPSDIEQQSNSEIFRRSAQGMNKFRTCLELFHAIWFVMGIVWVFDSRFVSFRRAPKLHLLCTSLLAWNAIAYSFPLILSVLLCCCVPLLSKFLGYNMSMGSFDKGASDEQLSYLPSWTYKQAASGGTKSISDNENPECCICLAKYKDQEELRQLPCSHIFHLRCVDQWLRIISCCPLCKQELQR